MMDSLVWSFAWFDMLPLMVFQEAEDGVCAWYSIGVVSID